MADVPRSISLTKNLSNVGHSKHIYDGVFSAPTATKRHTSTFSIRIDDYLDIFSPSDASLGSSIPIFDLPAVDRSDIIGRGRSSAVDYAGVFAGLGDDQLGIPTELLFRESKKKEKANSRPSRSSKPTKITVSRSQEFFLDSGNKPASESPAKTSTTVSKGQELFGSTKDNPTPSQISESARKAAIKLVSEGQEFGSSSKDRDNTLSSQASKTPIRTRLADSKSQEFCVDSRENEISSNVSTEQQFHGIKHLNTPLQKIDQSSKDAAAGITQIAHLRAVPEHIDAVEEVSPAGKISLNKANQDTDLSMDVSKGKGQGKQTRSISDLGKGKQLSGHDAHRAFGMGKSNTFNVTHKTGEADCRPESVSPVANSPQLFGSNDYFRRSSSKTSKSSTKSQQSDMETGSTSPLLELDVNSTAAVSVAAVERAIEEAEAKIRRAKEFLKGHDGDGSTHLSFKRSLKVKTYHSTSSCGRNQSFTLEPEEEKLLEQNCHLDATVISENVSSNEASGLKLEEFTTSKSELPDEVGMSNEKLYGVSSQEDTTIRHASKDPIVRVNDVIFVEKGNSAEVVTSTEKSYKDDGSVEWEAAKHISQLISGVKNRFVSFISKQVDIEKILVQDIPSSSRSVEQFEGSTDADVLIKRAKDQDDVEKDILERFTSKQIDAEDILIQEDALSSYGSAEQQFEENTCQVQDQVEKDDEMINDRSSGVEEIVHVSNICMNMNKPEEHLTVALEEGNVVDDIVFQDVDVLIGQQSDMSVEISGKLIQEEFQDQSERILDDGAAMEHEKDKVEMDGCEEEDMEQITACQSEVHVLEKEIICKDNNKTQEYGQDQELVDEGCSWRETEMPEDSERKLEDCPTVEKTCTDELQEIEQVAELFAGVTKVTDDTIEHDEQKLEDCTNELQETLHATDFFAKSIVGVNEVTDDSSEHDKTKLDGAQIVEEAFPEKLEGEHVAELFTWEDNETVEYQDVKGNSTVGITGVTDVTSEHDEQKLDDAQIVEEVFTDKLEGVQVAELFTLEANETVEFQDVNGKSAVGVSEVTDDEKKLEDAQMVEEICTDKLQGGVQVAEVFTWEDSEKIDTSEHDEKKIEENQTAEESCTDKLQEGIQAAEVFTLEPNETVEFQDVKGKSTVGVTEVIDDEKRVEDAQMLEETCTGKLQGGVQVAEVFTLEANETVEFQDVNGKSAIGASKVTDDEKKLEDAQMVEETCTDKLQGEVQVAEVSTREDSEKIDTFEHDEKKFEDDQIAEDTCTDKLQGVQVAELLTLEPNETVDFQNVKVKSTVGDTEVIDEEKKLEDAQMLEETCTYKLHGGVQVPEVFTCEDSEKIDTFEHDEKELEDDQSAEETCTDKLQGGAQVAELFTCEGNGTIDTFEHDKKKLQDAQMVEETCTDKLQGGVQVADFELFTWEDNEAIEHTDVENKITIAEVEDTYDHDEKKLQNDQIVEETCTDELHERIQAVELFTREENDLIEHQDVKSKSAIRVTEGERLHEESSQDVQHVRSCSGGEEKIEELATIDLKMNAVSALDLKKNVEPCLHDMSSHLGSSSGGEESMEEPITCHVENEMNVEQPICSQATQLVREDMCEQNSYPVADDVSKHDDYFPEMSHTSDQEKSSMMRNVDTGLCNDKDQYPQDVDSVNFGKLMVEDSKTEGNIHKPSSTCTIHDLIKKEMYEQTGCYTDVANETLTNEDECSPPADETLDLEDECSVSTDACKNEVHSFLTGDNEGYRHNDRDEHSQDIEFSCEDEKMAESVVAATFEPELSTEQPDSVETFTNLIKEDITETSVTVEKTPSETDVDIEQEYTCEEVFPVDINSKNQGDESEVKTDVGDVDKMHDADTSYKRKRWSENRVQADEFHQSRILLDQENTQGSTVDDGMETKVDEKVKESGIGTNASQNDACSSAADVCHITEAYHRRRRWFENKDKEVLSKPIVFDGAGMTSQMDDQIAKDSEIVNEVDAGSDQVECKATAKSDHRRRRWFESREKLEPIQKPSILEDIGVAPNLEEFTAKPEETAETSTTSIMENNHRDQRKREKEKKRERKVVQRAIREARERAFVDAQERAALDARQKAAAQDKQEKVSSEAKSGSDTKATMDAKQREERAAVERATSEARERAMQKAIFEKAASMSKQKDFKNQTSTSSNPGYSSATFCTDKPSGVVSESPRRRKSISERHKRTMERAAKALEEKNMRDFLAQKEEAERNRLADTLDVDVKRWLTGKDGNLQAMLSTLQYILGPDSGWQPIPLTDLVTSTAVRKAYKRAALCVHPDKLQQRGATIQQKYICDKVFDLLKDAWNKFNPDDW